MAAVKILVGKSYWVSMYFESVFAPESFNAHQIPPQSLFPTLIRSSGRVDHCPISKVIMFGFFLSPRDLRSSVTTLKRTGLDIELTSAHLYGAKRQHLLVNSGVSFSLTEQ